jgi:pentalenolactone synthase
MGDPYLPVLPFDRPNILDPAPLFRVLQADQPVARVRTPAGDLAWLVTRYEDVKTLLADDRLARSHPAPDRAARFSSSPFLGGPVGNYDTELADHALMRKLITPAFSARRMAGVKPRVQGLVDGLLDRLERMAPPVDFHEEFSFPLPVLVICELLGVPYEDREQFRVWSDEAANLWDESKALTALKDLAAYLAGVIQEKRRNPGEDAISDLVARDNGGQLSDEAIIRLSIGLLFAGHETTVARIDFGTLLLLSNPDQRQALQRDPELADGAVEEILRVAAPSHGALPRYARADIEIGDVAIRAGDLVVLGMQAANRDPAAFPDPDRFDIQRGENGHVAFGFGHHFCIGASLARVELQTVFGTLFRRFPGLRLAVPIDQLRLRSDLLTGGLTALPVVW